MATFVGIDLGTTNSVVAYRNAYGRPEVIPNREGQNITPSVVYFGTDPPAVGQEAKEWARLGNEEIASFFKPHMGSPLYQLRFHGRDYDATDLSALVLRRLKEDAEAKLGEPVDRAVITVPAYFADAQRKATIDAGNAAGLEVLRIINEPTAAALAYGLQKTGSEETVLIYDLGGGTFDVTVARITPDEIAVLATAGDHDLGGKNWDDRIATFLSEKFAADTGCRPARRPRRAQRGAGPERAGQVDALRTVLDADHPPARHRAAELRADPGRVREHDLPPARPDPVADRRGARPRRRSSWRGADRRPARRRLDADADGPVVRDPDVRAAPRAGVNVDEVVALGAAIQAAMEVGQDRRERGARRSRSPVRGGCSTSCRTAWAPSRSAPTASAYVNDIVIRRNLPIPAENTKSYLHATHGGANDRLEVYLTQGESPHPLDCTILGKYAFAGIQATDAEVTVDIRMSYDANGVVQVAATQRDTGHALDDDRRAGPRRPVVARPSPRHARRARRPRADAGLSPDRRLVEHGGLPARRGADRGARVPRPLRLHPDGGRPDLVLRPGDAPGRGHRQRPQGPGGDRPARGRRQHEPDRGARAGPRAAGGRPTGPATSSS